VCRIAKRSGKPDRYTITWWRWHGQYYYLHKYYYYMFLSLLLLLLLFITTVVIWCSHVCLCVCTRSWTRGAARVGRSISLCAPRTFDARRRHGVERKKIDNEQNRGRPDNTPLWVPRPCLPVGRVKRATTISAAAAAVVIVVPGGENKSRCGTRAASIRTHTLTTGTREPGSRPSSPPATQLQLLPTNELWS